MTGLSWRTAAVLAGGIVMGGLTVVGCESKAPEQAAAPAVSAAAEKPAPPSVAPMLSFNALMVSSIDNAGHVLWDTETGGLRPQG